MSNELTTQAPANTNASRQQWRRPPYRVHEDKDAFTVTIPMPGVGKKDVDISLDGENLTIVGHRAKTGEDRKTLRREIPDADYRLALRLNVPVNQEAIRAEAKDGLIKLTLPKAEEVKPRKIAIE